MTSLEGFRSGDRFRLVATNDKRLATRSRGIVERVVAEMSRGMGHSPRQRVRRPRQNAGVATVGSAANTRIPRDKPSGAPAGGRRRVPVTAGVERADAPLVPADARRTDRGAGGGRRRAERGGDRGGGAAALGEVAPATWNRHAATVRSFLRYAARHRLLPELGVELDRRREPADRTRALPRAALERLWARRDVAARRQDAVAAAVRDRRARRRGAVARTSRTSTCQPPRGDPRQGRRARLNLHWQTGTGQLLPRLIADRPHGPVFLTDRRRARPARRPRSICARTPAGRGCPTVARRSSSPRRPAGGRCTSCATPRSPTWPRTTSACRC